MSPPLGSPPGLFCPLVRLPQGWERNVCLQFDAAGRVAAVETGGEAGPNPTASGPVVPGMPNVHSHAFQRAIAGLTHTAGPTQDSFWTWRTAMYRCANERDADALEAIALHLYIEMLKQGYTAVGEFHYLHHQPNGRPYPNPAALAMRMVRAAGQAGIGLTLLPVLYTYGDFGSQAPTQAQRRFLNDLEAYQRLYDRLLQETAPLPGVRLGVAPHSLRAVSPSQLEALLQWAHALDPTTPVHLHIAEQEREVEACYAWSGQRPVDWLLDHAPVDERWCLIHATHMTDREVDRLAKTGAVVGLCPTTEADLGDGLFPAAEFLEAEGKIAIGSDSNTRVSPAEELRMLEYGQRLKWKRRNVLRLPESASIGAGLYGRTLSGGAQALGRRTGQIAVGFDADLLVLNAKHPLLAGKTEDQLLDTWIFAGNGDMVRDVYVRGNRVITDGQHPFDAEARQQAHEASRSATRSSN